MDPVFGIDVSKWQGDFDFAEAAKQGAQFAVIRAGGSYQDGGCFRDPNFTSNLSKARQAGLQVGVYWYSQALTVVQIAAEVEFLAEVIKDERLELPVYLDIETLEQAKPERRRLNTAMVLTWRAMLLYHGFLGGVYSFANFFRSCLDASCLVDTPIWVASYAKELPDILSVPNPTMWQFGGDVNYIRGLEIGGVVVDQNYLYIDWTPFLRDNALNNMAGQRAPIREVAQEVLDGEWGNGEGRRKALESAGYNYALVQAEVNRILKERG